MAEDIKSSFLDVISLMGETLTEGNIEYVRTNTETISSKGTRGENSRTLYVLPLEMDPGGVTDVRKLYESLEQLNKMAGGVTDVRKLYESLEQLNKMAETHEIGQIKVAVLGNIPNDYLRKCLEYIFRGSNKKIELVARTAEKTVTRWPRNIQNFEKVIIKSEGKNYADILKSVKNR
ncbi:hypothetical protein QE152_g149 [Popillia japonica]|uniref:Uncharacterized protein n=1 Tax=Popillia japonica TaxID=7064 RepID=A0AAW1NLU7_POPJA